MNHCLIAYTAPQMANWQHEALLAGDDPACHQALLGPVAALDGVYEIIPSWGATTPAGSWIEIQLRVHTQQGWSKFYRVAIWDAAPEASRRTSFASQQDEIGRIGTDTLFLNIPADALQVRVLLCAPMGVALPHLDLLTLCVSCNSDAAVAAPSAEGLKPPARCYKARLRGLAPARVGGLCGVSPQLQSLGKPLVMPLLISQYLSFPGGEGWCSPTVLGMVLAYWHTYRNDPRWAAFTTPACVPDLIVPMVHDPAWEGTGNWAFNTAYVASLGLYAYVTRLHSLNQVARWVQAGVPVICSIAWEAGEIEGAVGATDGHLTLVIGVDADAVTVAEPASRDMAQSIRRYRADQFATCWQNNSAGAVYLLYPPDHPRPAPGADDAWF